MAFLVQSLNPTQLSFPDTRFVDFDKMITKNGAIFNITCYAAFIKGFSLKSPPPFKWRLEGVLECFYETPPYSSPNRGGAWNP
jgi:hypothetical protein